MKAEELRKSILQQAIQGKLVAQDPTDEPTSILLERIREEKKQLVKDKKIKKDKNESVIFRGDDGSFYEIRDKKTSCIDEELPFTIPDNWEWCRGYSCFNGMESTKPQGDTFRYIDIDSIDNKQSKIKGAKLLNVIDAPSRASRKLEIDNVLFSMVRPYLKNVALVTDEYSTAIASTGFYVFKPNSAWDSQYLFGLLTSPYVIGGLNSFMKGDNSPSINGQNIQEFIYPIPPIQEQQRIVERLNSLEPFLAEYDRLEKEDRAVEARFPEDLNKSILQYAIQGKLVAQDPTDEPAFKLLERIREEKQQLIKEKKIKKDKNESRIYRGDDGSFYERIGKETRCIDDELPFTIPDTWEWCRLGSVIKLLSGRDLQPDQYNSSNNGIPYVTGASNITNGNIIINRWTSQSITISQLGDLLITCKGTIGTMAINNIGDIHIARQIMAIKPIYIEFYFVKLFLAGYISILQASAKSMIPGISRENILFALIPIPPLSEQQRIIKKLNQLKEVM